MRLLIVDDSKAMQNIITKSMKGIGYINDLYHYADDGEEALAAVKSVNPDLIITDLHMPKMNGLEMIKTLRKNGVDTTILLVSIDDTPDLVSDVLKSGANAFLKKPFTPESLYTKLGELKNRDKIKDPKRESKASLFMPNNAVFERVLGAMAGEHFTWTPTEIDTVDFDKAPFYGGTFLDEKSRLVLALFLDITAANLISAIMSRSDLKKAQQKAADHDLNSDDKAHLMRFLELFTGLCLPTKSGQLISVHGDHFIENARANLELRVKKHIESTKAYAVSCGACKDGRIILL